jgi:tetratricopeptide (TPR) repeat protein
MTSIKRSYTSRSLFRFLSWKWFVGWLLLIPEVPLLVGLALLAWSLHFPPLIGLLGVFVVLWFFVRSALLLLAEYRIAHGDQRRAPWLAQAALWMYPWSVDALLLRAHIEMGLANHAATDTLLRRAARLNTPNGDVEAARATNQWAQGVTPPQPAPHVEECDVSPALLHHYARMALHIEHDANKAIDLLQRAMMDRLPASTSSPLLLLLAEAHIAQGRREEADAALQCCEAQLAQCGRVQRAEALYHLGRLWQALGKDGTLYFRRSVELDNKGQFAHAAWRSAVTGK